MKPTRKQKEKLTDRLGGRANCIAMAVFAVVALTAGIIAIEIEAREAEKAQYIDSWPITINQHIEWNYAGKGGF